MRKLTVKLLLVLVLGGLFVTLSAPLPVSAVRKSAVDYYKNLTDADRLKIRIAMDMAIPREAIIDSVLQGLGLAIATPVHANGIGYDPTITPRVYDQEAALDLMEEVFGYRYNDSADTVEDRRGYFPMVLMASTTYYGKTYDERIHWAAVVTKSFQEIGIDTTIKYANWNIVDPCVFSPAENEAGFDYEHGGQDAFFIGWSSPLGKYRTDVSSWFGVEMYPPAGLNIGYCASHEVSDIINASLQDPVWANRIAKLKAFQQWFYDNVPYFILVQESEIWAKDPKLTGVDPGFTYPNYRNWTHSTQTAITVHSYYDKRFLNLDPMLSDVRGSWLQTTEWYDSLITNYPADPSVYYGNLAYDNWTTSGDGLVWDFWIREGIKFSDGTEMTIDDVVFSLKHFLHQRLRTDPVILYSAEFVQQYINDSSIEIVGGNHLRVTLNRFDAYASDFFTFPILSEAEVSPYLGSWPFDTRAPMGTGAFMMDEEATDLGNGTCVMVQNPYYDGSLRDLEGQFANENMLEKITVKAGTSVAAAVEGLKNGTFDIIDPRAELTPFLAYLNATANADWSEVGLAPKWGHQALYINHFSPYWGMNPADPRLLYPGDYAEVPFDLAALFFGVLCLATVQMIRHRKR